MRYSVYSIHRSVGNGFTLIETLIALSLVGTILLPSCLWFYQSRASRAAMNTFRATQALEMRMNRALLLRQSADLSEEIPEPGFIRFDIHLIKDGAETRLLGSAKDRRGRILSQLQSGYFESRP